VNNEHISLFPPAIQVVSFGKKLITRRKLSTAANNEKRSIYIWLQYTWHDIVYTDKFNYKTGKSQVCSNSKIISLSGRTEGEEQDVQQLRIQPNRSNEACVYAADILNERQDYDDQIVGALIHSRHRPSTMIAAMTNRGVPFV